MIDLKNLDKLTPEQRSQFNALLEQFPHLDSKMSTSRELNTPTKLESDDESPRHFVPATTADQINDEIDYTNFMSQQVPEVKYPNKDMMPKLKVNPDEMSFTSLGDDGEREEKPKVNREELQRKRQTEAGVKAGQPYEIASFNPEGKVHPVLQKLRATVGLRSVQKPVVINIGGCNYSMKALDRASITNATILAMTTTTNQMTYESNLESAIVAYSIVAIDGVPIEEVFSIPHTDVLLGEKEPTNLTHLQRQEKAAQELYMELLRSPNELVEALGIHYQQEFPPLSLLGEGKARFLCPEANCVQARIANKDDVCYCPIHGVAMAREDQLPNPL